MFVWLLILTLLICSLALAFSGIWRSDRKSTGSVSQQDQALYHARISEIDTDFELGRIDEDARDAAKNEQARMLLKLSRSSVNPGEMSRSNTFLLIAAAMVFVPVLSLLIYQQLGTPDLQTQIAGRDTQQAQSSLEELIAAAEKQLAENPDDIRGWRVVAPVYMRTGRLDKAANALRNLMRLGQDNPKTKRTLAEVLVLQANNRVNNEAFGLFKEVLATNSEDASARFFVAIGELQRGNEALARNIWEEMRDSASGTEPWLPGVVRQLQMLDGEPPKSDNFSAEQLEQIEGMVSGLAERLDDEPEDKSGWVRLVRSYLVLQRPEDAKRALAKVRLQFENDLQLISELEAMIEQYEHQKATQ